VVNKDCLPISMKWNCGTAAHVVITEYGTVQYFDVDMEIWVIEIDWLRIPLILYSAAILM